MLIQKPEWCQESKIFTLPGIHLIAVLYHYVNVLIFQLHLNKTVMRKNKLVFLLLLLLFPSGQPATKLVDFGSPFEGSQT